MVARNKMVISGTLGSPAVETWSISTYWTVAGGGAVTSLTELQGWATAVATLLDGGETDYTALTGLMGTYCIANKVDLYAYGPSGPAITQATAAFSWAGSGAATQNFTTSLVCSLYTDTAGRSYRGRFYFPALAAAQQGTGKISGVTAIATDFQELLQDLAVTNTVSTMQLQVYSPTKNAVTPVTSIKVGDVVDTQRRRRDALNETYQVRTITP